ncbi:uncharacterized protein LOC105219723 [Zeugodacus cucurbitae]|uniref:uncharacterized protein LOC105219723 n=1 Tax=Zeugodacus cucurbitae TaxID=28588 RepID=UPI0023D92FBD|nr:uncharacterized protein LOC105219723 [Zeugodacus cucurbitae]
MDVSVLLGLLIGIALLITIWFLRQQSYWRRRGIPHSKPIVLMSMTTKHVVQILRESYQQFKGTGPFAGFFLLAANSALIVDLELVKKILVKDFNYFSDRGLYNNAHDDPLSGNMFFAEVDGWKRLRAKLTPTFTSGKMKNMFHMVNAVGERFAETFYTRIGDGDAMGHGKVLPISDLTGRYTTDTIGTCAFGIECNSLNAETPDFVLVTNSFVHRRRHNKLVEGLIFSFPRIARFLGMRIISQHVHDFYIKLVEDTLEYRKNSKLRRNDFLDLLIDMREREDADGKRIEGLSVNEIAAQTFLIFLAGFETSATTMSFALYLLAQHPDIQEQLRRDINEVLAANNEQLTYECVKQMRYLHQVICETLRMYPIVPNLMRKAQAHYDTGDPKYYIEKGTLVIIPTIAIHYDPQYYPDPERFEPARFTAEEIQRRPACTWLPFGEGPRNCIGMRFGRMQTSIGLIYLLRHFRFSVAAETEIPCPLAKVSCLVSPANGIQLRVDRVEGAQPIRHSTHIELLPPSVLSRPFVRSHHAVTLRPPPASCCILPRRSTQPHSTAMLAYGIVIALYALLGLFTMIVGMLRSRMVYWSRRGVAHDQPAFILGNLQSLAITRQLAVTLRETYDKYKHSDGPFCGFYLLINPVALVTDLDLARSILIRDFQKFDGRGLYHNKRDDAFSENLFSLEGDAWRALRRKLTPLFTTGKTHSLIPIVSKVGDQLTQTFAKLQSADDELDVHDLLERYTTDVIANGILGLECNSLASPDTEFRTVTQRIASSQRSAVAIALMQCLPKLAQRCHLRQTLQEVRDFYYRLVGGSIVQREENKSKRDDLMSALIELKNTQEDGQRLTLDEIIANSALFFSAGYETSSATLTFALYELALNQKVQTKLRQEITETLEKQEGKLTAESLNEMQYLDMVIAETLRKYPINPYIERVSNEDYETAVAGSVIYAGTKVLIPIEAIQHDPEIFPEPEKFKPERFETEKIARRHSMAWLPFGEGPRNCIGMRFGQVLIRIGLISLLSKYKFSACSRTPTPMVYDEASLLLKPQSGLYLHAERLS